MNIMKRAEDELHDILDGVAKAYHVALNGSTDTSAIVYRISGDDCIYESGKPILMRIKAQIYIYQHEYTAQLVWQIKTTLELHDWSARIGAQALDDGDCYRDELIVSKNYVRKDDEDE